MSNKTLLYSGAMGGGKSTFIGGLYTHVISQEDIAAGYWIQIGSEIFENDVISPLLEKGEYSHRTREPYMMAMVNHQT
jgi:hypothetical protein